MRAASRALALALITAVPAPCQSPRSTDASIGVWPWLAGNIDSYADEIVAKAKSTGLDTIYVHVWRTTGSRTGELRIADEPRTWSSPGSRVVPGVRLSRFIAKAHAAGLQVVGVVQVFGSPRPLPSDRLHQDFMLSTVLRYIVHSYDARGQPYYALDGIALDYIRWFGGNHDATQINRFLDAARREVGGLPIHCFVIAGAYALDGGSYDNKFRSYRGMRSYLTQNYGQDWEAMAARIDCLMPMAYTANGHVYRSNLELMEGYVNAVARYGRIAIGNARAQCRLVPAIRTWNSTGQTTTRATIEACAGGAMRGGASGFMAFRYFTARGHADWFKGLATWSVAGPDLPIARFTATTNGLGLTTDDRASSHSKVASLWLRARYDVSGSGAWNATRKPLGVHGQTLPGPGSRVVAVEVVDPGGHTAVARAQVGVAPILTPLTATVSAAKGGPIPFGLNPGTQLTGGYYVVFSTLSGTSPGARFERGVVLPINVDVFTVVATGLINTPPFLGFFGRINAFGLGYPQLRFAPNMIPPALVGRRMHFAALDIDPSTSVPRYASNAIELAIQR